MRFYFLLWSMMMVLTTSAQDIEPNLKWGNPTQEELTMTEYAPDKDADAVELCRQVDVFYEYNNGDFSVVRYVKCRWVREPSPDPGEKVGQSTVP